MTDLPPSAGPLSEAPVSGDDVYSRVVAIDGPGGSGKSTVAKLVAEVTKLGYLDTGAMYRSITFGVLRRGLDPADWAGADEVLASIDLDLTGGHVVVDGEDATAAIRGPEVTAAVSAVSANPSVRVAMVRLQREWIAKNGGGVLEGRDIGTVVAPAAAVKVFMTATTRERAQRRAAQSGEAVDAVEADLIRRDKADAARDASPMKPADDSVIIDTTGRTIDSIVDEVAALVNERTAR